MLVTIDSKKSPGLVATNLQNILEEKGAKGVEVMLVECEITMPFGEHKGKSIEEVPAKYLDWLRGEEWVARYPLIVQYLQDNKQHIDWELDDDD